MTLIAALRRVLIHQEVTLETIYGALSAYLLLGLTFSAVYGAMEDLGSQPLFTQVAEPSIPLRQYFSFATLTTLGYGDVTAATDIGPGGRDPRGHLRPDLSGDADRSTGGELRRSPPDP